MKAGQWVVVPLLLVIALVLAGCATPAEQSADGDAEAPAVATEGEVTITWWTESGGLPANVEEAFIQPFEEANPGIKLEIIPQESINDTLRTAIQAGEAPDILQTPGASFIAEFVDAGTVEVLDTYADDLGWEEKLLDWAYQSGQLGGNLYSIPLTYESMVLYYNKALFDENGWEVPTNLEEFNAIADAAVAAGINPLAYGNATWQPSNEHLMGIYLNNVAGPENVYNALTGAKQWTDPEFADATELLRQHIADNGWFSGSLENYFANSGDDANAELASGDAAMMMSGTWLFRTLPEFFDEMEAEWAWAPLPTLSPDVTEYNYQLATGSTLSINADSEHKDEAAKVIDFLISDPVRVLTLASASGFGEWMVPVPISADDFPVGTDQRIVDFFSDFAAVTGDGRIGYTTWTFWPAAPNVQLWEAVESVWVGELSIDEYLAEQQALWDQVRETGATLPVPAPGAQ